MPKLSFLSVIIFALTLFYAVYIIRWLVLTVHACQYAWIHMFAVLSAGMSDYLRVQSAAVVWSNSRALSADPPT